MNFWNDVYRWHTSPTWNGGPCRFEVFWKCQMCQPFFFASSSSITGRYFTLTLKTEKYNNTLSKQLSILLKHPNKNISIILLATNIALFPDKKKLKCTLVQVLRLCTSRTAHRGSRGIALLFPNPWH
jgi:hypothetical protein